MTVRISKSIRANAQFQALASVFGDDEKALVAWQRLNPEPEPEPVAEGDPRVEALVAAGFTVEEAAKALGEGEIEIEMPPTEKEKAEALVAERGFSYAKGRVYGSPLLADAIKRVHGGKDAEIVPSSGVGRTKAVLVYREESGDVALQNLTKTEADA